MRGTYGWAGVSVVEGASASYALNKQFQRRHGICDLRVHSSSFHFRHRLRQHSSHVSRRLWWGNGFLLLLEGVLTPQTTATPQLHSFIGVRREMAEAAFHRPSRARHTVLLCALAPLSCGYRWLKL